MALLLAIPFFFIALLIGAALLKLACKIIRAEVPPLGGAMWVVFVAMVVQGLVVGGLSFVLMRTLPPGGDAEAMARLGGPIGGLINLGSFALAAFVYWRMLGLSTYWWALLLNLVHTALGVLLALFLGVGVALIGGVTASQLGDLAQKVEETQGLDEAPWVDPAKKPTGEKAIGGTIYKWKDRDGRPHYSDRPPPAGTDYEVVEMAP